MKTGTKIMKEKSLNKLLIKNMVCQRCILTVESIMQKLNVPVAKVAMGEIELRTAVSEIKLKNVDIELKKVGFELIETKLNKIVENIKKIILEYISDLSGEKNIKLSSLITGKMHYDYSYLSDLFSSIEGVTIEQFFILQRIEKVKELIVYEELSLTEISYQTGFSSVHHLSAQFKKITGLTPSHFKKLGSGKRKSIDNV
jgi:AraC family transcriptional regulator